MCAAEVNTLSLPFQTPFVAIFIIVILKHYLKKIFKNLIKPSAQSLGLFVLTIPFLDDETQLFHYIFFLNFTLYILCKRLLDIK